MESKKAGASPYVSVAVIALLLLALGGLGYLGFLAFVENLLMPEEFAVYGLIVTTLAAAVASFFSPCSFTVLPSYLAFAGSASQGEERVLGRIRPALKNGMAAAAGVVVVVALIGVLVGAVGTGIGPDLSIANPDPSGVARGLRIGIGAFVLTMGLVHILDLSHHIPLLGKISAWAIRAEGAPEPSSRATFAYGAGYVVVGIG